MTTLTQTLTLTDRHNAQLDLNTIGVGNVRAIVQGEGRRH